MMKKNTLITPSVCAAALLAAPVSLAAVSFTENFDSYTAGGVDLQGQGGWSHYGGTSGALDVETVAAFSPGNPLYGMSGNVAHNNQNDAQNSKALGGTFNAIDPIVMSFDTYVGSGNDIFAYFGVLDASNTGQRVHFALSRESFEILAPGGNQHVGHGLAAQAGPEWINIRMTIDPAANTGIVEYAEYDTSSVLGSYTSAITSSPLGISDWTALDTVWTRTADVGALNPTFMDNLSITQVPEPSSTALLGLGGLALILRRRK